jgi:hypothetical protein
VLETSDQSYPWRTFAAALSISAISASEAMFFIIREFTINVA